MPVQAFPRTPRAGGPLSSGPGVAGACAPVEPVLSDAQWARIAPLVSGKPEDRGSTGRDNRMFVEAVLWIARTGAAWRDLPPEFGGWNTVFRRHRRWMLGGVWQRVFAAMADDPGFGYALQGEAIRPVEHQH